MTQAKLKDRLTQKEQDDCISLLQICITDIELHLNIMTVDLVGHVLKKLYTIVNEDMGWQGWLLAAHKANVSLHNFFENVFKYQAHNIIYT